MTRSYFHVPADRPDRLRSAFEAGADAIVADLHEGLAHAAKDESRRNTVTWLDGAPPPGTGSPECWVRINSDDRTIGDLDAVVHPRLTGIVLPRATLSRLGDLEETITYLENDRGVESQATRIEATIDSAQGVLDAVALASHPRVDRLAAGEVDLTAELGVKPTASGHGLWPLRMQLVVASAAAAIAAPVGPAQTDTPNLADLRLTSQELAAAGFGARPAIDITQIRVINEVFTPTPEDVAWADRLIADLASRTDDGLGGFTDAAGSMVDEAVVRRARRIVADARQYA